MLIDVNGTRLWFDVEGPGLVADGSSRRQRPSVLLVHGGTEIFPPVDPARSIWSHDVFRLGTIPLDPGPPGQDPGVPVAVSRPGSAFTAAMHAAAGVIRRRLGDEPSAAAGTA